MNFGKRFRAAVRDAYPPEVYPINSKKKFAAAKTISHFCISISAQVNKQDMKSKHDILKAARL